MVPVNSSISEDQISDMMDLLWEEFDLDDLKSLCEGIDQTPAGILHEIAIGRLSR